MDGRKKIILAAGSIIRWAEMEDLCGKTGSVMKGSLKMTEEKEIHIWFTIFLGDISNKRWIFQFLIWNFQTFSSGLIRRFSLKCTICVSSRWKWILACYSDWSGSIPEEGTIIIFLFYMFIFISKIYLPLAF